MRFLVETGTAGYQAKVMERKGSLRAVRPAEIELEGVRVPEENRLPGGESFDDHAKILVATRSLCASTALGHAARAALAEVRDLLGDNGVLLDVHVIRPRLDIEAMHTFEGPEAMQTLIVGKDITDVGAFT